MFNLKDLSDEELIKLCQEYKNKDAKMADSIFNELYLRYYEFLYLYCQVRFNNSVEADILFERTWARARKYLSYDPQKKKTKFATWLMAIAKKVYIDVCLERMGDDTVITEPSENPFDDEEKTIPKDVALMEEALNSLPPRENEIIRAHLDYETGENKYMPGAVLDYLCNKFNTSRANIRKIKQRSLDFLKKYVESRR